jgi:proteasome assembly chaperone (PAC2) family protein
MMAELLELQETAAATDDPEHREKLESADGSYRCGDGAGDIIQSSGLKLAGLQIVKLF